MTRLSLKKLSCKKKHNINKEDIYPLISEDSGQSKYNVFELIDTALSGNLIKTKKIFKYLKTQKTESHLIIWMAIKSLRLLCQLHQGIKTNKLELLYQKHQVWPKRQKVISHALKRLNYNTCLQLIRNAYEVELTTKGNEQLMIISPWRALEIYIMTLAGIEISYIRKSMS